MRAPDNNCFERSNDTFFTEFVAGFIELFADVASLAIFMLRNLFDTVYLLVFTLLNGTLVAAALSWRMVVAEPS